MACERKEYLELMPCFPILEPDFTAMTPVTTWINQLPQQECSEKEALNIKKSTPCAKPTAKKLRKLLRNQGEAYIGVGGKYIPAKQFDDYNCQCKDKCMEKLGNMTDREEYFKAFWNIGNFSKQNEYLFNNVTVQEKKFHKNKVPKHEKKSKTCSRIFYIKLLNSMDKVRVCKKMFLKLHGVSNGRLDRILQGAHCVTKENFKDKRGQHTPSNKIMGETLLHVKDHINSFNIISNEMSSVIYSANENHIHINNGNNSSMEYLSKKKMYTLYKQHCMNDGKMPVSMWTYINIYKNNLKNFGETNTSKVGINEEINAQSILDEYLIDDSLTKSKQEMIKNMEDTSKLMNTNSFQTNESELKNDLVMSRKARKLKRNCGESYVTSSGNLIDKKIYTDNSCKCKYNCIPEIGTLEKRRSIFDHFWKIGDFTKQNEYISERIELVPIKNTNNIAGINEKTTSNGLSKTCTRIYKVIINPEDEAIRVCKRAFLSLHGVSNGRVGRIMQAIGCNSPFALQDRRGYHEPKNKINSQDLEYICNYISSIYSLEENNCENNDSIKGLSVEDMYRIYKKHALEDGKKCVSNFSFRKILRENFCDLFQMVVNKKKR